MNNMIILIFTLINILSDTLELTYEAGVATRKYILPAVIFIGVGVYHYTMIALDKMTSMETTLKVYRTPLTTGLAFA